MSNCRFRVRAPRGCTGRSKGLLLILGLALGGTGTPGQAQSEAPTPVPASSADPDQLETVVVTARKREESEAKVPGAISVVGGKVIDERGLETLSSLETLTPNLQITDRDSIRTVFIRGVGGGGRQIGFDTRAGVYVDGVYIGAPPASESMLLDLERVEVLRGPQGYLFGQGSTSGAISMVTRAPEPGVHSEVLLGGGNRGAERFAGSVNLPLGSDALLLRLSTSVSQRDEFTHNVFTSEDVDDLENAGGRARLRWKPADDLTVDVSGDVSRQGTHIVGGEPRTNTFGTGPAEAPESFETSNNSQERDVNENQGVSLTVDANRMGGEWTSISAWRSSERDWKLDGDRSSVDWVTFFYDDHYRYLSQELRFASEIPSLNTHFLVGVYALAARAESQREVVANAGVGTAPGPVGTITPGDRATTLPDVDTDSYAAFTSVDVALSQKLTLNAGVRVTRYAKDLDFDQTPETLTRIGARELHDYHDDFHETSVDPTVGLQFFATDSAMLYAKFARGSKSGGFNADFLTGRRPEPEQFDQETVNSYEVGYKDDFFERRLRANLAVFLADYRDYQVQQVVQFGAFAFPAVTNAGKVRTYGPELSLLALPVAGLRLTLDAAYLHAEYREFEDGGAIGQDYTGNRIEYAPRFNASGGARYEHAAPWGRAQSLFMDGVVAHRSSQYSLPSNADNFHIDGRTVANLRTGVAGAGNAWEASVFADNLFDEHYDESLQTGTLGTVFGRRGTPRTYGLQLRRRW